MGRAPALIVRSLIGQPVRYIFPRGARDAFSKGMAMLHKIENNADVEIAPGATQLDGFARNRRDSSRRSPRSLAGMKTRELGSVAVQRKALKSRTFSNSLRSIKQ